MRPRGTLLGLLLTLAAFAVAPSAEASPAAREVPKPTGWVTDEAGIMSAAARQALNAQAESWQEGSGHEIAVLIIDSLQGESLEGFALEVARAWGLGQEGVSDGALLLVSTGDRKIRIEVGRGLEGELPDATAARIIRDVISPAFKAGDFDRGITDGVLAMHGVIGGDYAVLDQAQRRNRGRSGGVNLFTVIIVVLIMLVSGRGRRGRGMGPMGWFFMGSMLNRGSGFSGRGGGGFGGGGFGGFGGGGGFSGGGSSGGW